MKLKPRSPRHLYFLCRRFGVRRAFQLYFGMGGEVELTDPSLDHPALARPRTSDYPVFRQVCIWREYQPLAELAGIDSILDLGANVGYTSAFLLSRFPSAKCLSVEPDPGNFRLLQRNLEPYGDRAEAIRGGAWNRCCHLAVAASPYRGGAEWTRQVEERPAVGPDSLPGYDVPALMGMLGVTRLSILKVDIEGAEALVFDNSCRRWIGCVDHIAIELHDDSSFGMASPVFWRAALDAGFEFARSGELVLCHRR